MKVHELLTRLQDCDLDAEVHFSYNYGDYWRTMVAPRVSRVDEGTVVYSKYHSMPRIAEDDDDDKADNVIILS